MSDPVIFNVTANTSIIEKSSYTEYWRTEGLDREEWYLDDILYVTGNLTWDNGTVMEGYYVNVTINLSNGTIIDYKEVQVDSSGLFNASFTVDDDMWPDYQSETIIKVNFNPFAINNFGKWGGYIEGSNKEYQKEIL
jgi:hypothetical protein